MDKPDANPEKVIRQLMDHDVVPSEYGGDTLVVSLLAEDHLGLYDVATGADLGGLDLSAWDDGDGSPEADAIVPFGGDLYVALGRLDTSASWNSADGTGTILQVDCDTLSVTAEWTTGPNPGLSPYPGADDRLLLRTGDYFDADWNMLLDGALATFDPVSGTIGDPLLTEEAFGKNLGALVGDEAHAMLVTDDGYSWNISCVDLATWDITPTDPVDSFLSDGAWGPDGKAWMVYRPGFADNGLPQVSGLVPWDPATCTAGDAVATTLPPSSLALVP